MRRLATLAVLLCPTMTIAQGVHLERPPSASEAMEVLRSRNLKPHGEMLLLDAEKDVIGRAGLVHEARDQLAQAAAECDRINGADADLAQVDARRLDLTRFVDACYIQMDSVNPYNDSRQAQIYNDAKNASIKARAERQGLDVKSDQMRRALPTLAERRPIQAEFERRAAEYARSVRDALEIIGPTTRGYSDIAKDRAATDALADLRKATGKPYKIGPSVVLVFRYQT